MKDYPGLPIITVESEDRFADFLQDLQNKVELREYAVILEPEEFIDEIPEKGGLDATQNLAHVLSEVLRFKVLLLKIHNLNLRTLGELAAEKLEKFELPRSNPTDSLAKLLRMSAVVFGEGGRQSIYDSNSFKRYSPPLSQNKFISLLEALRKERSLPYTAPGVFICLSHQGMAEAHLKTVRRVIDNADRIEDEIRTQVSVSLADRFSKRIHQISEFGEKLEVKDDSGCCIAKGIRDRKIMVHRNECTERKGEISLHPYSPSLMHELPPKIPTSHRVIAKKYSGLVEDIIGSRSMSISMLHGDEVEECTLLYVNWAFRTLWPIKVKICRTLKQRPKVLLPNVMKNIICLPMGVEITSSTYYPDSETPSSPGGILTEVASTAVYYHEYPTGVMKRDLTFQFHPEVGKNLQMVTRQDLRDTHLRDLEDGIMLLIAAAFTGTMPVGYVPL